MEVGVGWGESLLPCLLQKVSLALPNLWIPWLLREKWVQSEQEMKLRSEISHSTVFKSPFWNNYRGILIKC